MNNSMTSNYEVLFSVKYSFSFVCVLGRNRRARRVSTPAQEKTTTDFVGDVSLSSAPKPTSLTNDTPCTFQLVSQTKEEEEAYDYTRIREDNGVKTNNLFSSVANLVKGTLGAGLLSSHVAYMKAGLAIAIPLTILLGICMGYCMSLLVYSAQVLYKRTTVPSMTYSEVGEAAMSCFPNPKVSRFSKVLRYYIDGIHAITLFGNCACYQLIIAKSVKQLVDNIRGDAPVEEGKDYLELRLYVLGMLIPIIMICLVRHLKYLAPFSIAANAVIVLCMIMGIYYAATLNPKFENLKMTSENLSNFIEFNAMIVFGMSCATISLPVENSMKDPRRFPLVLSLAMITIVGCTITMAFFGYSAFLDKSDAPITVNFPMDFAPNVLKGLVALMLVVSHAISFWILFNLCWVYIKEHHHPRRHLLWEYFYRVLFVLIMAIVAITFPNIRSLIGFIGALCITNLCFILPNIIFLLVIWHRPGLGKYNWRLWNSIILILIGLFCCVCGTFVSGRKLIKVITAKS